jgi:hypothetical protein
MIFAERTEVFVITLRAAVIASLVVLGTHPVVAQELSRYRGYALGTSLASVVKISGTPENEARTLHERPAQIQELKWRAPYVRAGTERADPVRDLMFRFYNDQLYQVVVTYDRDRVVGLITDDVIESISATYGVPLLQDTKPSRRGVPDEAPADVRVVAQWEDGASLLTLMQNTYPAQYQLALISKTLDARARAAIEEALRLDAQAAPQRELDQRQKEVADAAVASSKARVVNKVAFRP